MRAPGLLRCPALPAGSSRGLPCAEPPSCGRACACGRPRAFYGPASSALHLARAPAAAQRPQRPGEPPSLALHAVFQKRTRFSSRRRRTRRRGRRRASWVYGGFCAFLVHSDGFGVFWCLLVHFGAFGCILVVLVHFGTFWWFWCILVHFDAF